MRHICFGPQPSRDRRKEGDPDKLVKGLSHWHTFTHTQLLECTVWRLRWCITGEIYHCYKGRCLQMQKFYMHFTLHATFTCLSTCINIYLLCLDGLYFGYKVWLENYNWGSSKTLVSLGFSKDVKKNVFSNKIIKHMMFNGSSFYVSETKLNYLFLVYISNHITINLALGWIIAFNFLFIELFLFYHCTLHLISI